ATAPLYTLALHDALPILQQSLPAGPNHRAAIQQDFLYHFAFDCLQTRLAKTGANLVNGHTLTFFDLHVDIDEGSLEHGGDTPANGRLPRAGVTRQNQILVGYRDEVRGSHQRQPGNHSSSTSGSSCRLSIARSGTI